MLPAIINTLLIALVALLVAIPIGVGGAIYLAEYAKRNSPLVRTIRLTAETLQASPPSSTACSAWCFSPSCAST